MSALRRILDLLSTALMAVGAVGIIAMMMQVMIDVAMRSLWKSTLPGTEEMVSAYYMIAVTFLPLAYVQRQRGHVIIELFTMKLPERVNAAIDGVVYVVCSAALWIFTYAAFRKAVAMTAESEIRIGTIDVTVWPTRWFVVAGLAAMALYMLLHSAEYFLWAAGKAPPHTESGSAEKAEPV